VGLGDDYLEYRVDYHLLHGLMTVVDRLGAYVTVVHYLADVDVETVLVDFDRQ
jgi:hypothetical protein